MGINTSMADSLPIYPIYSRARLFVCSPFLPLLVLPKCLPFIQILVMLKSDFFKRLTVIIRIQCTWRNRTLTEQQLKHFYHRKMINGIWIWLRRDMTIHLLIWILTTQFYDFILVIVNFNSKNTSIIRAYSAILRALK